VFARSMFRDAATPVGGSSAAGSRAQPATAMAMAMATSAAATIDARHIMPTPF
jgi:hypothetical protein